jgi:hypothetical protein
VLSRAQRQLAHKNIVSFIDSVFISAHSKQAFQSAADEVYILMEHCSGSFTAERTHMWRLCISSRLALRADGAPHLTHQARSW